MSDREINEWWNEYIDSDLLDRNKMVKKLPLVIDIIEFRKDKKITDEQLEHLIIIHLISYFDDCIEEMDSRNNNN